MTASPATSATRPVLVAGMAVVLVAALVDSMRSARRRTVRRVDDSWARYERREARRARQAEIALLATRLRPKR